MRKVISFLIALALSGCAIYSLRETAPQGMSPGTAKVWARTVLDPADIPTLFKGCTGSHRAESHLVIEERGTSVVVTEDNRRECPDAQLN